MKILITGVTGFLGEQLACRFSQNRLNSVYGIARNQREEHPGIRYIYGDVGDLNLYASLPDGIDVCIHAAAMIPRNEDLVSQEQLLRTNVLGTLELVKYLSEKCRNAYLIHFSTANVYKPNSQGTISEKQECLPDTSYGLSKLYSEVVISNTDLQSVILRLTSVYDTDGKAKKQQALLYYWLEEAKKNQDIVIWGTGKERRNYLHVNDVLRALDKIVTQKPQGIYNIASNEMLSMLEMAKIIISTSKSKSQIVLDASKNIYAPFGGISIEKATRELGFYPKISFQDGIQRIVSAL
jgi:UDP-glucose 4-epimerase